MRLTTKMLGAVMAIALFGMWVILMTTLYQTPIATAAPARPVTESVATTPHSLPPDHPKIEALDQAEQGGPLPLPATRADIQMPGTQPNNLETPMISSNDCKTCHSNYDQPEAEPYQTWQGSMMSQAARDPLFYAALDIANQDVAGSGEYCIRCHAPKAWLEGRIAPDGSQLTATDQQGVSCHFCHRMVDPEYEEGTSPAIDESILAALTTTVPFPSTGMYVVDPNDNRRAQWDLREEGWFVENCWDPADCENNNPHRGFDDWPLESPFHTESAFCGTCHDVSNPLFSGTPGSNHYTLNAMGQPIDTMANAFPVERTYTEWLLSDYGTEQGVFAPQWNPEESNYVNSCQDCHMASVADASAAARPATFPPACRIGGVDGPFCPNQVTHDLVPVHDLTGGNTWVPEMIKIHPEFGDDPNVNHDALDAGIVRARAMLQKAASLTATHNGTSLDVRITNETGHKLPTGYAEGRQMWVSVVGRDAQCNIIFESGAYNYATGELDLEDPQLAWFGVKQALSEEWAGEVGLPAGESFHFLLNNEVELDNRIPPRGFNNAEYAAAGAGVIGATYADGQYWADVDYSLPAGVTKIEVGLHFQIASKEYIEFLRDTNVTSDRGDLLYELWEDTNKAPPETLARTVTGSCEGGPALYLPLVRR
jgi:hypothetical protein